MITIDKDSRWAGHLKLLCYLLDEPLSNDMGYKSSWTITLLKDNDILRFIHATPEGEHGKLKLEFELDADNAILILHSKDGKITVKNYPQVLVEEFPEFKNWILFHADKIQPKVVKGCNKINYVRLYYYMPAINLFSVLSNDEIKASVPEECNDPLEFLPAGEKCTSDGRRLEGGFISFSSRCDNPLMWSHYANSHRGVCLEFMFPIRGDIKPLKINEKHYSRYIEVALDEQYGKQSLCNPQPKASIPIIAEVAYLSERPEYSPMNWSIFGWDNHIEEIQLSKLYVTKSIDWQYEAEWRMLVNLSEALSYNPEIGFLIKGLTPYLSRIILGERCPLSVKITYAQVRQALRLNNLYMQCENSYVSKEDRLKYGPKILRARFDSHKYLMIPSAV